jgi:hypothetical protein
VFNIAAYGAVQGHTVVDAVISGGALSTLTSASAHFSTNATVGQPITVGKSGTFVITTIAAIVNDTTVTLTAPIGGAITAGIAEWGAANDTALAATVTAATAANGCVFVPKGTWVIATPFVAPATGLCLLSNAGRLTYIGSSTQTAFTFSGASSSQSGRAKFKLDGITLDAGAGATDAILLKYSLRSVFWNVEGRNSSSSGETLHIYDGVSDNFINFYASNHMEPWETVGQDGIYVDGDGGTGTESFINATTENFTRAGRYWGHAITSVDIGGTSEDNGWGVYTTTGSAYLDIQGQDLEANTTGDIFCSGLALRFRPTVAVSTGGTEIAAGCKGSEFTSGFWSSIAVDSGANIYGNHIHNLYITNLPTGATCANSTSYDNLYHFLGAGPWPSWNCNTAEIDGAINYGGNPATPNGSVTINNPWTFNTSPLLIGGLLFANGLMGGGFIGNDLLYSNTFGNAAWTDYAGGVAVAPNITATNDTAPDGTTTATDVTFSLNSGTTTSDQSYFKQSLTGFSNPHSPYDSVWVRAKDGQTCGFTIGQLGVPGVTQQSFALSPNWARIVTPQTVISATSHVFFMGLEGGLVGVPNCNSVQVAIAWACDSLAQGPCPITTTPAAAQQYAFIADNKLGALLDSTGKLPYTELPLGTSSQPGAVQCDGTSITCTAGVIAALGASSGANTYTGIQTAPGFWPQTVTAGPYLSFFDDYLNASSANIQAGTIGSPSGGNGAVASATFTDINHPGNFLVTSGTAGTGTGESATTVPGQIGALATVNLTPGWKWESAVDVPVLESTTNGEYQAGLVHTVAASPWTTGVAFLLSSANGVPGDWYCEYASTTVDSTVAATTAWVRLSIVSDATNVHWYINGTEVCGTGVAIASMPSTLQQPAWTSVAKSATSVQMAVDYVTVQRQVTR